MKIKTIANKRIIKAVTDTAIKSSERAVNSSCILWQYQPKTSEKLKKLRKF